MKKELYLTNENICQKHKEWLDKLKDYSKNRIYDLNNAALLVIDMQNFFLDENSHAYVPSAKTIIPNIKKITDAFNKKNFPVIYTRFCMDKNDNSRIAKWWDDKLVEGTKESKIFSEFNTKNNIVIRKANYSSFKNTELDLILKQKNIKSLIITGIMTHLCCDSTARDAFMNDYNVYFVIDATASYNEDLHLSSLKGLSHGFVNAITTGDIIEKL